MSEVLSLEALRAKQPKIIDVPLEGLGTMRVARLNVDEKLNVLAMVDAIPKDDEGNPLEGKESIDAFVDIACKTLVGPTGEREFDCPEGRELVSEMDDDHFGAVMDAVLVQIGMGNRKRRDGSTEPPEDELSEDDNLDAAKKRLERVPMYLVAMMVCEAIGCPHPRRLPEPPWEITWDDLTDWHAYLLWKHGVKDEPSDAQKQAFLASIEDLERAEENAEDSIEY